MEYTKWNILTQHEFIALGHEIIDIDDTHRGIHIGPLCFDINFEKTV